MSVPVGMKLKIHTYRRIEMETMHLSDTLDTEWKALCGADVSAVYLMGVEEYLERRNADLQTGNVCGLCKVHAVGWAENRIVKLEADVRYLRDRANEIERTAESLAAEGAESQSTRYLNGAKERRSEADGLDDEANELHTLVERLRRETGLEAPGR